MKIKIKGVEYNIKYTVRAMFIFEQITNRAFEVKSVLDNHLFFYSLILANNKDTALEWEEFLDAVDEDPDLIASLNKVIMDYKKKDDIFEAEDGDGDPSKKN